MRSLLQLSASQGAGATDAERVSMRGPAHAATPALRFRDPQIEMAHGAGGKASRKLVEGLITPILCPQLSGALGDAASVSFGENQIAVTTDGFVVNPLRFPGGSIG